MRTIVLSIHPAVQIGAITLALYVFYLGLQRSRSLHLGRTSSFNWKRHVTLGTVALTTMLLGIGGGLAMVYMYWKGILLGGLHGETGLAMVPLILFGLSSGLYMDRHKKKRTLLPPLHGVNNLVLLILALSQVVTGDRMFDAFVAGG